MFEKLAKFFIENTKLTFVLIFAVFVIGISSYFSIPKQYNPEIVIPAFNISVKAPNLSTEEINKYIVSEIENKVMELEEIDEVMGYSSHGFGGVMAKFNVGVDKEKAKIRLNQKLSENMDLKPLGASNPFVESIDADELSQITYAISYNGNKLNQEEKYIYLRQIANILKNKVKILENVTTIDIVGGYKKNLIINLDFNKINSYGLNITNIVNTIKGENLDLTVGSLNLNNGEKTSIHIFSKNFNKNDLEKIVLLNNNGNKIYLTDVSEIKYGIKRIKKISTINGNEAVFIGFGKSKGTNAVGITKKIKEEINEIKKELPKDIDINIIQDEGITAKNATDNLMVNLFQSIFIVIIILTLSLGFRNALNTAISIPLTLFSVFTISLIIGENINRITLFALILVLGMLVDDSTVVVENINRHLKDRFKNGKTKLGAVLNAIKEVQLGVILSTVTRLLAFGAMFAVGGMMGEYMGPIPKFALMASILSTFVALTINPWISFNFAKDENLDKTKIKKSFFSKINKKRPSIRKIYINFLEKFLGEEKKQKNKRKYFKIIFWITLFSVIIGPIYFGIFKARMLPKSNQNQLYVWIDAPRGWGIEKLQKVSKELDNFLLKNKNIETVSSTIGQSFIGDFANLFRGGGNRFGENQISTRINLIPLEENNNRISSEKFVINFRPKLRNFILEKFPDIKIKLLEDPPGPPVRSTFRVKIKGDASDELLKNFTIKIQNEVLKIAEEEKLVDVYNNFSTKLFKIDFEINKEAISRFGVSSREIAQNLINTFGEEKIGIFKSKESLESVNIIIGVKNNQINKVDLLNNIYITNKNGDQILFSSLVTKIDTFEESEIETDKREKTYVISSEVGDNSLIYPQIKLFKKLLDNNFVGDYYYIKSWNPYGIKYIGKKDGKIYKVEFGGEWKLTIDTFRDLGLAMGIALLFIYLMLVGQFRSFGIAGVIMITFLLGFFGVFPGFTILYLLNGEYFSATSMIGIIALAGIVVGNAIILIEYINILKARGLTLKTALLDAGFIRFKPIVLTSLTTIFGAATIVSDPVWAGLAWAIISGLLISSIMTLIVIPIFYYDSQRKIWK